MDRTAWRRVLLALVAAGIALVVFHPHWNPAQDRRYEYPVHMDEYVHWGYAKAVIDQGEVNFRHPFSGLAPGDFSLKSDLHEAGYWAYLGAFQRVTGVAWIPFFQYAPALIAVFLGLCVYALAERWGAGVEAAVWVICIPTTLRFLGPGFMVPIVFALPAIVLGLFCLFHTRTAGGLVAYGVFAAALWPIHRIGAFAMFALAALYGLFLLGSRPTRGFAIWAIVSLPFLAAWDFYEGYLDFGFSIVPGLPATEYVLLWFGIPPLILANVGAASFLLGKRHAFAEGMSLTVAVLLADVVILNRLYRGLDPFILYDRTYMILFVLASLLAGVGLSTLLVRLRAWQQRAKSPHVRFLALGLIVLLLLTPAVTVAASANLQAGQAYYTVLTPKQMERYTLAAERLEPHQNRALVEGISTMPFSIITGRPTMYVHTPNDPFVDPAPIRDFFARGGSDTHFLVANGVSVVVTHRTLENPDLREVAPGVYVLRDDYARRMAPAFAP